MKFLRRLWPPILLAVTVTLAIVLAVKHEAIMDWSVLRNYRAPATIQQLSTDDAMTPYGRHLLYVDRPQIENKSAFNQHCTNSSDQVIVLGCYTGDRQGIYLYNVTDSRLAGIEQVTAAHEMLHQAYERLSSSERKRIDVLLQNYYDSSASPEIKTQMANYKKTEPGQELNELHSVLGTEVASLPLGLETYYAHYFTSRSKVASYYQQYQGAFTERQKQVADYDQQLATIKAQIDVKKNDLSDKQTSLTTQRTQLEASLSSNQINQYNAAVPGFNAQVDAYRTELDAANALIDQYNQLSEARNAIAVQEQQLQQALDSHVSGAPKQ